MKVLKLEEISLPEVRDLLELRQKRGPLDPYQMATLSHASKFSKLSPEKAKELVKALTEKFKISRAAAVQIVNVLPTSIEELRTLLVKEDKVFLSEDLEKILELIRAHLG